MPKQQKSETIYRFVTIRSLTWRGGRVSRVTNIPSDTNARRDGGNHA